MSISEQAYKNKQKFSRDYNKENYVQLNTRISHELYRDFSIIKENYGSVPKTIQAGIEALKENEKLKAEIDDLKKSNNYWQQKYYSFYEEIEKMSVWDFVKFKYFDE